MTPLDIDLEERMKIFKKIEDVGLKTMASIKIFFGKNSTHRWEDILSVIIFAAVSNLFVESSVKILKLMGYEAPSPDRVIDRMDSKPWDESLKEFNELNTRMFMKWRKKLNWRGKFDLAIDFVKIPRYKRKENKGKKNRKDLKYTVKGKVKAGTHHAHCFCTSDVIRRDEKFTLAVRPVFKRTNKASVLKNVVQYAKKHVKIGKIFLDKEYAQHPIPSDKIISYLFL